MRRVVCIWFPTWPTDRLRRQTDAPPPDRPLVTALRDGSRRVIAMADTAARAAGLVPGMAVAHAQAIVPGLAIVEADPPGDAAALDRLAAWCLRYAPIVAADLPDGLVIDITGAAHLLGGDAAVLGDLTARLRAAGYAAQGAVADTWAAAWALARFRPETVAEVGAGIGVLAPLPVEALRLDPAATRALRKLGFDSVVELAEAPRASLALRFGSDVTRRLDQARGTAGEPIKPVRPPEVPYARLACAEPLMHADGLGVALQRLADELCAQLHARGLAARRLDLVFQRVDGAAAALRVGAARGTRDPAHIVRLFGEQLQTIDPGFGVEAVSLAATRTEPFAARQLNVPGAGAANEPDIAPLVDRIAGRIGAGRLYRLAPVESDLPERSVRRVPPLSPPVGAGWPDGPRPVVLLDPPEPVEVMALLPDHPPRVFDWRQRRTAVARADGPERVHGEWWLADDEVDLVRDYFRVEDTDGRRYWLFRTSDGNTAGRWFMQGAFG